MSQVGLLDPYEIARYIKEAKKSTPVKVYVKGDLKGVAFPNCRVFGEGEFLVIFGEYEDVQPVLIQNKDRIAYYEMENDRRNSAVPMLNLKEVKARIEPGAIIRDRVSIGDNAVIMMGAVLNIGAEIGENTMIDMNAVIGARGTIGKNVHVGAGSVIAGVLEPPSKTPVIVEDGVMIGANAVILEGVRVGEGAVVAAGAVVTEDVAPYTVVAGMPARVIKQKDEQTTAKTQLVEDLRQ